MDYSNPLTDGFNRMIKDYWDKQAPEMPEVFKQQMQMQQKLMEAAAQPLNMTPEVIYMRVIQELFSQNKRLLDMVLEKQTTGEVNEKFYKS